MYAHTPTTTAPKKRTHRERQGGDGAECGLVHFVKVGDEVDAQIGGGGGGEEGGICLLCVWGGGGGGYVNVCVCVCGWVGECG
jgi:hypothetical protein